MTAPSHPQSAHLDEDLLAKLAAGTLDTGSAAVAGRHLAECRDCAAKHEELSAMLFSRTVAAPIPGGAIGVSDGHRPPTNPDSPQARAEVTKALHQGVSLGRYVLLDKLGAGGMGDVFAAYDPQLDRRIALKLLRVGAISADEGRARLLREAQAMARLSHPNVVTVHDVGTFDDRVFVAMEFVEGETLSNWLRGERTWQDVIALFLDAGAGLAAAHRAGIVHRDFKPDNVLIGSDGRARVVDFGLARSNEQAVQPARQLVDAPNESLSSPLTRDGTVMGTPGYMAPEQIYGQVTDARTDQFAFCVALFEALYGSRPFGGNTLKTHAQEIEKGVLTMPARTEVPEWVLEVVQKGLRAKPAERFVSMEALLHALRPRRKSQRWKLVAAVTVLAGTAAVLGSYGWTAREKLKVCGGAERKLEGLWDRQTKDTLKPAFLATGLKFAPDAWKTVEGGLDPWTRRWTQAVATACEDAQLHKTDSPEVFAMKSSCLDARLEQLRSVRRLLDKPDVEVVTNAAALVRGLEPIETCLDGSRLLARSLPRDEAQREAAKVLQATLVEAKSLHDVGKYEKGRELLELALGAKPNAPHAVLAEANLLLGRLAVRAGAQKAALAAFFSAVEHAEAAGDARLTAHAFSNLAMVHGSLLNHFDEARSWERLGRAAASRAGNDPELEGLLASNSGLIAINAGDYEVAREEFEHALERQQLALGKDHPEVARTLNNLGVALGRARKFKEAREAYDRAWQLHLANAGPDHPDTASSMFNIGMMYRRDGDLTKARELFSSALAVREATLGQRHPDTATSYLMLGNLESQLEHPEQALENLQKALLIREGVFGPEHPKVADVYDDLAEYYLEQRFAREAFANAQKALAINEKALGAEHPNTLNARDRVAAALRELGQWDKANAELNRAFEARKSRYGPESDELADSHEAFGALALAQGKGERALQQYDLAFKLRQRRAGDSDPSLAESLEGMGKSQLLLKKPDAALEPLSRAVQLREKSQDASELSRSQFQLARALYDARPEEKEKARGLAEKAREQLPMREQPEIDAWLGKHP